MDPAISFQDISSPPSTLVLLHFDYAEVPFYDMISFSLMNEWSI